MKVAFQDTPDERAYAVEIEDLPNAAVLRLKDTTARGRGWAGWMDTDERRNLLALIYEVMWWRGLKDPDEIDARDL